MPVTHAGHDGGAKWARPKKDLDALARSMCARHSHAVMDLFVRLR
jgi:hypothetical protein